MTKRTVTVEIDLDFIAREVNGNVGETVETVETVGQWLDDNDGMLRQAFQDAIAFSISEGYDV